jgi:ribosomal protein L16 Arg81 hydroxylase
MSGSEHQYAAHTDCADGLLFQLAGRKELTVWNLADEFYSRPVYSIDFERYPELFRATEPVKLELAPGDAAFIPRGALHEVSIPRGEQSVSVSFRAGSPYLVRLLCADLCEAQNKLGAFDLPVNMRTLHKFRAAYFDPVTLSKGDSSRMPELLRRELLKTIQTPDDADRVKLPALLDEWWGGMVARRAYPGYAGPACYGRLQKQFGTLEH